MNTLKWFCGLAAAALINMPAQAQDTSKLKASVIPLRAGEYYGTYKIDGQIVRILIIDGDTLPVADLDEIQVTLKRDFENRDERKRYHQWRKYAAQVYPYAAEAIRLFRKTEKETEGMKKSEKRKYSKNVEKLLRPEYEEKLKELSKTQGYILIKMVERELKTPFFDVVSSLEGEMAAVKWQTIGRFFGYNLKSGYNPADDELLESILQDLNITYGD